MNTYLGLIRTSGTLIGGVPLIKVSKYILPVIGGRKKLAGSMTGGIQELRKMLDYCAQHALCRMLDSPYELHHHAYDQILKRRRRYRFVIDMATL